jgi:hypothetical protein
MRAPRLGETSENFTPNCLGVGSYPQAILQKYRLILAIKLASNPTTRNPSGLRA